MVVVSERTRYPVEWSARNHRNATEIRLLDASEAEFTSITLRLYQGMEAGWTKRGHFVASFLKA